MPCDAKHIRPLLDFTSHNSNVGWDSSYAYFTNGKTEALRK